MIALLLIIGAGLLFRSPDVLESPITEWKEKLAWAQGAVKRNDTYGALAVYEQVFREASFSEDWEALIAVACGLIKLRRFRGVGLTAETVLLRAIAGAAEQRSQRGLQCAAKGLKSLGVADLAASASSKISEDSLDPNDRPQTQQAKACSCNE